MLTYTQTSLNRDSFVIVSLKLPLIRHFSISLSISPWTFWCFSRSRGRLAFRSTILLLTSQLKPWLMVESSKKRRLDVRSLGQLCLQGLRSNFVSQCDNKNQYLSELEADYPLEHTRSRLLVVIMWTGTVLGQAFPFFNGDILNYGIPTISSARASFNKVDLINITFQEDQKRFYGRFCRLLDYTLPGKCVMYVQPFGAIFRAWVALSYLVEILFWWFATQVLMVL